MRKGKGQSNPNYKKNNSATSDYHNNTHFPKKIRKIFQLKFKSKTLSQTFAQAGIVLCGTPEVKSRGSQHPLSYLRSRSITFPKHKIDCQRFHSEKNTFQAWISGLFPSTRRFYTALVQLHLHKNVVQISPPRIMHI